MGSSFLIIGGGIIGHVIAWQICRAYPDAAVTLLERDMVGAGATCRSAGLHFPLGRTAAVRSMSQSSEAFYKSFCEARPDAPIVPLGLRVHARQSGTESFESFFTEGADLAPDPDQRNISDALGSQHRIWRAHGAHRADVAALTLYISGLLDGRLCSYSGIKVVRIVEDDSAVRVLTNDGLTFEADAVILAPGPWALAPEFQPFTESLGIRIKRVVAFHVDGPATAELQPDGVVDLFIDEDAFLMPRPRGGRLFSFTRQHWDVSPEDANGDIDAEDRAEAVGVLSSVAPRFSGSIGGGQAFCDAYSPTRAPIVAGVGQSGRVIFAGAANGSGYRLAPAIAHDVLKTFEAGRTREING
ncbi:NAD(P)/FAD-dependent oxidoreductase [uncultured Bradyrhizobium sp.]|uniref:NAD(P)/FAD-dependent oxidoreductase n=1 Tax=uncultured Bradyrhizobium sp. TaxID=199684 RepID=UPI0035C94D97